MYKSHEGLTVINTILGMTPSQFKQSLSCCHTIECLREEFDVVKTFLTDICQPRYSNKEDMMTYIRYMRATDDDTKEELRKELEGKPCGVNPSMKYNGVTYNLSPHALKVVVWLKSNEKKFNRFYEIVNDEIYNPDLSTILVFNKEVHTIVNYNENYLNRIVKNYVGGQQPNKTLIANIDKSVNRLELLIEEEDSEVQSTGKSDENILSIARESCSVENLNNIFGFNTEELPTLDMDGLYQVGVELSNVGLIGFNPYTFELYQEYKETSLNYTDRRISVSPEIRSKTEELRSTVDCMKEVYL